MIRYVATALSIGIVAALGTAAPAEAAHAEPLEVTLTPKHVSFGHIPLGASLEQEVTATNTGTEPLVTGSLSFSQIGGPGGFTTVDFGFGTCGPSIVLAPGESCAWSVDLTAGVRGRVYGTFCFFGGSQQGTAVVDACTRYSGVIAR